MLLVVGFVLCIINLVFRSMSLQLLHVPRQVCPVILQKEDSETELIYINICMIVVTAFSLVWIKSSSILVLGIDRAELNGTFKMLSSNCAFQWIILTFLQKKWGHHVVISLVSIVPTLPTWCKSQSLKYPCGLNEVMKVKEEFSLPEEPCPLTCPSPQTSQLDLCFGSAIFRSSIEALFLLKAN